MTEKALVQPGAVVVDCPDPAGLARFYAELLGWPEPTITQEGYWATVFGGDGSFVIEFQRDDHYQPPTWPDPERPQMFHLDFAVTDMAAAAERALAVGAKPLDLSDAHPTFHVYADPAGHPFCLCAC
jgi:catechol 2,3-dioxygenase-like lactoylglutathione lyase family enzyme